LKIAIIGGGIGGMTLALALDDAGLGAEIDIYESDPGISELGVGINVLPHAVRELTELGLGEALAAAGIPTAEIVYYSSHGQRIWGEPRGLAAGYQWPQFSIHRGELLMILYNALVQCMGRDRIHTGHHLEQFGEEKGRMWANFVERGSGAPVRRVDADLLVGCDGVHSVVRHALYPDEGPPKWNGITMWRGVTSAKPFLSGRTMIMAGHFARRVVAYPISKQHESRGEALINWVAELKTAADQPMPRQDWQHAARKEDAVRPFETYTFDFLDIPAMIRGSDAVYQYPMVDRDPLPKWSGLEMTPRRGPVTLLGDAAHPMYPVGSNGASQAILDARVLARELATRRSIAEALAAYEAERRPATAAIVAANRKVGPEKCMEIVEQRAPCGFTNLEEIISVAELEEISRAYKLTAGFDPQTLNARASFSVRPKGAG
jgi:2-polyprenyl-6-methoxyphenol hydroxylase-like FAD-dependent oxidoreductase